MLLEICNLLAVYGLPSILALKLLAIISRGLRSSEKTASSSQIPHIPKPNTHVLILRCLNALPGLLLDAQLGEAEMGTLMEGLNSPDETIRRSVSHTAPGSADTPDTSPPAAHLTGPVRSFLQ